jgi:hypothetical protein
MRSRDLKEAMAYYGDRENRFRGWTEDEMTYMRRTLDGGLMKQFGYAWSPH